MPISHFVPSTHILHFAVGKDGRERELSEGADGAELEKEQHSKGDGEEFSRSFLHVSLSSTTATWFIYPRRFAGIRTGRV